MQTLAMYSALCTGMVVTLVRIREPYFYYLIKSEVLSWFGEIISDEEQKNANSD